MTRLFFSVLLLAAPLLMKGQTTFRRNVDIATLRSMELPVLDIVCVDSVEPTYDEVSPPPGGMGKSITNATKVPGRMTITLGADTLYDSGFFVEDQSGITIKVRGNTSAYQPQKPFKIKLQKKADLLCRGNNGVFGDKHWVLLADISPNTGLGFAVSRLVGMEWTPAWEFVNVVLNGQYRGMYVLCEQIRRNTSCRLNVDATSGYIIEHDAYWWNEPVYFTTTTGRKYTFNYPDEEDVTEAQVEYIHGVVSAFEESIADGTYPQHIDVASFVRFLLAHDILGTWDSGGTNQYIAKQNNSTRSLLRMPCLWDFGTILKMTNDWSRLHTDSYTFFPALLQSKNTEFVTTYMALLQELMPTVFDGIDQWLADFAASPQVSSINRSRQFTAQVYGSSTGLWSEAIASYRRWFRQRRIWLQNNVKEIVVPTEVSALVVENDDDGSTYDLMGRRVSNDAQGFVVRRGKLYYIRK